jgi:hypothetical protein
MPRLANQRLNPVHAFSVASYLFDEMNRFID